MRIWVTNRAEFQRLIADCECGKIDIVLTKSISRFARNTVDLLEIVRHLKLLGIEVRFEKEGINSISGDGELMLTILASFAQEESFSTSENIKWRFRNGFQNGKQKRTQVYGYRWSKESENFVIEPTEAEIVRYIFNEYLAEKSPRTIAADLNSKGISGMYGEWWGETITSILGNEKYIGTVIMQKTFVVDSISKKKVKNSGELPRYVIENSHPAIVSEEVFNAVQKRLNERKIEVNRTAFTGKVLCEKCGCNFQRSTKTYKGKSTKKLACGNKKQGIPHQCDTVEIPEIVLEKVSAEVLEIEEFNAEIFSEKIKQIVVPSKNILIFHFYNGKTVTKEWKSTASKDSWTAERRAEQAEQMRGREVSEETRQKRREATTKHYENHPERRIAERERMLKFCAENPEWGKLQNERMLKALARKKSQKTMEENGDE